VRRFVGILMGLEVWVDPNMPPTTLLCAPDVEPAIAEMIDAEERLTVLQAYQEVYGPLMRAFRGGSFDGEGGGEREWTDD
jgi:hypothetical protein